MDFIAIITQVINILLLAGVVFLAVLFVKVLLKANKALDLWLERINK